MEDTSWTSFWDHLHAPSATTAWQHTAVATAATAAAAATEAGDAEPWRTRVAQFVASLPALERRNFERFVCIWSKRTGIDLAADAACYLTCFQYYFSK
jgi:hypothetical protein